MLPEVTLGSLMLHDVAFLGCAMLLKEISLDISILQPPATCSWNLRQLHVTLRNLKQPPIFCSLNPEPCTLKIVTSHQLRSAVPFGSPAPQFPRLPVQTEIH